MAQINSIIKGCPTCVPPQTVPVQPSISSPAGDSQVWCLNNRGVIITINVPYSSWIVIPGTLRYIDALPQSGGSLVYGINSAGSIFRTNGNTWAWQNIPGTLAYLRISAFDQTVWGINSGQKVFWLKDGTTAWNSVPGSLKYLDISPKDGAVWGTNSNQDVLYIFGVTGWWVQILGLKTAYLRIISNGYVFALGSQDGSIYYTANPLWTKRFHFFRYQQ